jgi:hypothetical protein
VVARRAQVLADGQHLDAVLAQHAERLEQLFARLAEPGHQARLRHDALAAHLLGVAQHTAGAQELRAAAGEWVEPRHRLDVVVEDVGALGDDARERHLLAAEVGCQNLDLGVGREAPHRADHSDERRRAEIGQVVAVDAGDHRVT